MKTADFRIAIPFALMVALGVNGAAFAKNGSDDPPGDDRGGAGVPQTSDDPPGDDRGGPGSTGGHGHHRTRIRLEDDAGTRVKSKFNYQVTGKVKQLKGVLKLPLPNEATGITDPITAEEAVMIATFAHKVPAPPDSPKDTPPSYAPYAVCTFIFDRIKNTQAQYKFDVKQQSGSSVKQKQGTCDTDLAMAGIQPGIPGIHTDDRVTVEFQIDPPPDAEPFTIELGQGTFF